MIELFQNEELIGYLSGNATESEKSTFDYVVCELDIEVSFARRFENDENVKVKVYVNLPSWFKIDTPIGSYNPDWAFVIENDGEEKLYFVLETKGTKIEEFLPSEEKAKMDFARKHFEDIGTNVEFIGPEKDINQFMLRVLSRSCRS
ncbi:hypothetical protein [Bacillus alveayuensis]|uniref:restriction endonuclease n=1 Tax=Aeribacillus alveayuensis TaxID=279215 RepID=UPI0005D0EA36|nr:hypothetical protein [Bacillus alveayuensis]